MPSHLTRQVFRRLIANEPIFYRGCLRRQAYHVLRPSSAPTRKLWGHDGVDHVKRPQKRAFFNFNLFPRKTRDLKEVDNEPGIDKMMELAKRERMRARMPPPEDVADAIKAFINAKKKNRRSIQDNQAQLMLQSLKYYMSQQQEQDDAPEVTTKNSIYDDLLATAAKILKKSITNATKAHIDLAEYLHQILSTSSKIRHQERGLLTYVELLCCNGEAHKAREITLQHNKMLQESRTELTSREINEDEDGDENINETPSIPGDIAANKQSAIASRLWLAVLRAFASGENEQELFQTLELVRLHANVPYRLVAHDILTFYLRGARLEPVQKWFEEYWISSGESTVTEGKRGERQGQAIQQLLHWCLHNRNLEFGHGVVRQITLTNPSKPVWDAIFVWAAGTGKGVDEINRMLGVMEASNADIQDRTQWRVPDIATINSLVGFAVSKNDPYMAERFITLGKERRIDPDAQTYTLQMKYRLQVDDVDGALVAYKNLQMIDPSSDDDVPTVNKLIVAMCKGKRHDFETIMNVAADLSDRRARFKADTVSTLAIVHLERDEVHDVIDLLNTHALNFSIRERQEIRDSLISYCLNQSTLTPRAWDAYHILRVIFDETPREPRTELMLEFFKRERPDMAVHIFNGMRRHHRADTMPTADTYAGAFLGAAKIRDLESVELIHNQLKLDYNINVGTYLYNTLTIAYTACGKARDAQDFWNHIVASKEGPTYNSIHIALRTCEKAPLGDEQAKEIWEKLKQMNVELDGALWASYIAALSGNAKIGQAFSTIVQAEQDGHVEVDSFLIGSLFSGSRSPQKQEKIEAWVREQYPHIWAELEQIGIDEVEFGWRQFRIDRSVTP